VVNDRKLSETVSLTEEQEGKRLGRISQVNDVL
jgi:hypothetical protein